MKCFNCGIELLTHPQEKRNTTKEHIIPDSLGGRLTSYKLICRDCNSIFGRTIDAEVFNQLMSFAQQLDVSNDNGKKGKHLVDEKGELKPLTSNYKPKHIIRETRNGKTWETFFDSVEAFEKYKKKRLEQHPNLKFEERTEEPIRYPSNQYSVKNEPYFKMQFNDQYRKHMLKVGIEYYLSQELPVEHIQFCIENFRSELVRGRVYEYHPTQPVYVPEQDELSHVIYLKLDATNHLIYCFIEYFNFTSSLIVLNNNYQGDISIEYFYCQDVITAVVPNDCRERLNINLDGLGIREYPHFLNERNQDAFESRYGRLMNKIVDFLKSKGDIISS